MLSRRGKRKKAQSPEEVESRGGLYIQLQHAYAEPRAGGGCYRFGAPAGFECLGSGSFGDTFVSLDRREVRKCFVSDEDAVHEGRIFQRVAELALRYCSGPGRLVRMRCLVLPVSMRVGGSDALVLQKNQDGTWCQRYVLCMQNAGPLLWDRRRELSSDEVSLCLLQTIHFIALLGGEIRVADIHPKNVCVKLTGADIEVRWIDYGMWELVDPAQTKERRYVMRSNMSQLLSVEVWGLQHLASEEAAALSELLQECEDNASSMDWATVAVLAAESLLGLARGLGARLQRSELCFLKRTQALLAEVEHSLAFIIGGGRAFSKLGGFSLNEH
jgi:hypothetical protein